MERLPVMQFVAVAKDGVHIYDMSSFDKSAGDEDGDWLSEAGNRKLKPMVSLPAAPNAAGYAWNSKGTHLATVDGGAARVWDAGRGYEQVHEVPAVGESGGIRAVHLSPRGSFLATFERWHPERCPENVLVWDLRRESMGERIHACTLRREGKEVWPWLQWTPDESACLELVPGEGVAVLDGAFGTDVPRRLVPEAGATTFQLAPREHGGACYVACFVVETAERPGRVAVYHLSEPGTATASLELPRGEGDEKMSLLWNTEGSALLALARKEVDRSGASYFGTTSLYWLRADGTAVKQVSCPSDGLVQDLAWSPCANEFLVILGLLPATTALYNGESGEQRATFGSANRNTVRWSPCGRLFAIGGFGSLPGDLDFFARDRREPRCSFRAALTVDCAWGPDGKHFLTCTLAPRLNQDNQVSVHKDTGERLFRLDFVPANKSAAARERGLAGGDAGAMLFAACWRPDGGVTFADRPPTPPKCDPKETATRIKALKTMLAELEELHDKAWDELTDEDEDQLASEAELRAELKQLEKRAA